MRPASLFAIPAFIAVAVMLPCLAGWKVLGGADQSGIWYPFMEFTRNIFSQEGVVPLWLPALFGGIPFEESMVPGIYYPTDIICWLTGIKPHLFYAYDICLHMALAGTGTALLARHLGTGSAAGLFGGLAYMLGGYLVSQVKGGTIVFIRTTGLYPWIFLALFRALQKPTLGRWSVVAVLLALLPLTSAYQPLAYLAILLPVFVLLVSGPGRRIRSLGSLALTGIFSGILSAVTLLPAYRYFLYSIRSSSAESWKDIDPYSPGVLSILMPQHNPHWQVIYIGITTAVLAIIGLLKTRNKAWPWGVVAVGSMFLALGTLTPAGRALAHLPLFGSFRGAGHWIGLLSLSAAILAAMGFEGLFGASRKRAFVALAVLATVNSADMLRQSGPLAHAKTYSEYESSRPSRDPVVWFLSQRPGIFRSHTSEQYVLSNMRAPTGLEWISGYHGAPLAVFREFYDASMGGCPELPWLFAWMNAKFFIVGRNQQMRGLIPLARMNSLTSGPVWVCENPAALPRTFFGASAEPAEGIPVMLRLCSESPGNRRLYVHSPAGEFPSGRLPSGKILSEKRTPNRIEVDVASSGTGLVFFSDAFYPAWSALVDGQRARIHRVNVMFRGVAVPAGHHSIVMSYESLPFKLGLLLTFLGWTLAGLYALAGNTRE